MASAKKVSWAQLRTGVVALVAMIILAVLVFALTGDNKFFQEHVTIYTFLPDSAALTDQSNVRINGILAGKVTSIELTGVTDPAQQHRQVKVALEVEKEMLRLVPVDSLASISAENLLGTKFINIERGKSEQTVQAGGEITAKDIKGFESVVQSGYNALEATRVMLERLDKLVSVIEKGQGSIGQLIYDEKLYKNLNGTADEARKLVAQLNSGKGAISKLLYDDKLVRDLEGTMGRVNGLLDGLERGEGTMGKLLKDPAIHDDTRKLLAEFRTLAADLNAGKGTAGKLLKDDALHKQLQASIGRMDLLLDKINSGQGTLGQLVVNPQMYESMNGATREMHEFLKMFRENPKKYLSIKLSLF